MEEFSQISQALSRTGFPLENKIYNQLKKRGWGVISNKYYIDDVDRKARELDLIAYKVLENPECDLVFSIFISCKKDHENYWTFLSRSRPNLDPNNDWKPVHYWTDCEPLKSFMHDFHWRNTLFEKAGEDFSNVFSTGQDVFAYQLVSRDKYAPKDDRPIFQSVSSLMKALDHEKKSIPNRARGGRRIYLFTLATVVDGELIEASYNSNMPHLRKVDRVSQLSNYIVDETDVSSVVHFVEHTHFEQFLSKVSSAADSASSFFKELAEKAYAAIMTSQKVRDYFSTRFQAELVWKVRSSGFPDENYLGLNVASFDYMDDELIIQLAGKVDFSMIAKLNRDEKLKGAVGVWLIESARYSGNFRFDLAMPF